MRSRHKRTNNEHGHFTIINYMQKKTQKRDNSLNMGTFINEVCISCLQLLKTLYVCLLFWASLYAICTYVCSYLILARIKKVFLHACLYIPRFWLYHRLRTPRESFFFSKIRNFWAWADKLG